MTADDTVLPGRDDVLDTARGEREDGRRGDRTGPVVGSRHEPGEMSYEARGEHPDVEVTVERVDVAARRGGPGHRDVDGPRVSRRHAAVLLAAVAIVIALVYAGAQAQDAAREADANRQAVAAAKRASDFANVLALHETIFAASRRTTRVFRAERGRMNTASARMRLTEAVVPLEGLAFILRRGLAPIPSAADIWQRYLVCSFYTARAGVGPALDREVPELARFAQARRPAIDVRSCSDVALPARG